jgi:hypothetical protein
MYICKLSEEMKRLDKIQKRENKLKRILNK